MPKEIMKCPFCGSSVIRMKHFNTEEYWYKCTGYKDKRCHFALNEGYTSAEVYLQGETLESRCMGCGKPLTIACGPYGLYARCYECDYDLEPHEINGETIDRWANNRSPKVRHEIKKLRSEFKKELKESKDYGFDEELKDYDISTGAIIDFSEEFLGTEGAPEDNNAKNYHDHFNLKEVYGYTDEIADIELERDNVILQFFYSNLEKSYSARDIAQVLSPQDYSPRKVIPSPFSASIRRLKSFGFLKIVDTYKNHGAIGLKYQVMKSPLKELKTTSDLENYKSLSYFSDKQCAKNKYKGIKSYYIHNYLKNYLKENLIEPTLAIKGAKCTWLIL